MRISDWSSDVCSSDLTPPPPEGTVTLAETLVDELSRSFQNHLRRTLDDRTLLVAAEFDQPVRAGTWTAVFEQGLGDVGLPRAVGGFDLSEPELAQLFVAGGRGSLPVRSEEHTSELQALRRQSYAV